MAGVFRVMDPVHGSIELKDERGILRAIIDSERFQRLRKLKQLGNESKRFLLFK